MELFDPKIKKFLKFLFYFGTWNFLAPSLKTFRKEFFKLKKKTPINEMELSKKIFFLKTIFLIFLQKFSHISKWLLIKLQK